MTPQDVSLAVIEDETNPLGSSGYSVLRQIFPKVGGQNISTSSDFIRFYESSGLVIHPGHPLVVHPEYFDVYIRSTNSSVTLVNVHPENENGGAEAPNHPNDNAIWTALTGVSAVNIDLGAKVPIAISSEAKALLALAPWPSLDNLLAILRSWAQSNQLIEGARITTLAEPEDPTWLELVINLYVRTHDDEEAIRLWDEIGANLDSAKTQFSPKDKAWFDQHLAIHLLWGDETLNDDSGSV